MYHVLIASPKNHSVLAHADSRLPVTDYDFEGDPYELCQHVRRELNASFDLAYLRPECEEKNSEYPGYSVTLLIFQIVCADSPDAPEGYIFISQSAVTTLTVQPSTPSVLLYLEKYQKEALRVHAVRLYPYSQIGWLDDASKWIRERLAHRHNVKSIVQVKLSGQGCVLRVIADTDKKFYMKAAPTEELCSETIVVQKLAEIMPKHFIMPIAVDLDRKWTLMKDYGTTLHWREVRNNNQLARKVLTDWVKIQKDSISSAKELENAGIPKRDARWLNEKTKEMLEDSQWFTEHWNGMTAERQERFEDSNSYKKMYLRYVNKLCEQAATYKVPLTLVHGDLNAENVILGRSGTCRFIDHGLTCISYPFIDALSFAGVWNDEKEGLDFYLRYWNDCDESIERLHELLNIVEDIYTAFCVIHMYHFYANAEEGRRRDKLSEAGNPFCSLLG